MQRKSQQHDNVRVAVLILLSRMWEKEKNGVWDVFG